MKKNAKLIEKNNNIPDDDNPLYLFSTTNSSLLFKIINKTINPVELAKKEIKNRGMKY